MSLRVYSCGGIDGVPFHAQVSSMAWHIHLVEVENLTTKVTWTFPCDRWLAMQRGEGVTLRDVHPLGHPKCLQAPMTDYQVSHPCHLPTLITATKHAAKPSQQIHLCSDMQTM